MPRELQTFADCLDDIHRKYKTIDAFVELTKANKIVRDYVKPNHEDKDTKVKLMKYAYELVLLKYEVLD